MKALPGNYLQLLGQFRYSVLRIQSLHAIIKHKLIVHARRMQPNNAPLPKCNEVREAQLPVKAQATSRALACTPALPCPSSPTIRPTPNRSTYARCFSSLPLTPSLRPYSPAFTPSSASPPRQPLPPSFFCNRSFTHFLHSKARGFDSHCCL